MKKSSNVSGYSTAGGYYFPEYPRDIVEDHLDLLQQGLILDSGAGFGNNTKLLLEKTSAKIIAAETLSEALKVLSNIQEHYPERLDVRKEAVEDIRDEGAYDAVICTMVLHFLTDEQRLSALKKIQDATKPEGINIVSAYIFDEDLLQYEHFTSGFKPDELKGLYDGWDIIEYKEVLPVHPMKGVQYFVSAKIVARKGEKR